VKTPFPFPSHLRGLVIPIPEESEPEALLTATVACPCGGDTFDLLFPGATHTYAGEECPCTTRVGEAFFFLVRARCRKCGEEHLLIDQDLHGWNGVVCHDAAQAALPRPPLVSWKCP
jgi:hypothetical protein